MIFHDVVTNVREGRGQAVLLEEVADVFWRMIEITSKLHFLVTDGGDFGESAGNVGLHGVATV